MKIALLFYGRLNKFKEHKDNLLNAIGTHNDIDIFLSCSNEPDNIVSEFIELYKPKAILNETVILSSNIIINLEDKYISKFKYISKLGKNPKGYTNNMILHFMNKLNVIKLLLNYICTTNNKYDIVISLRLELLLFNNFNFDNYINNDEYIYIPNCYDFDGVNDQIAYGNLEAMKKYMSIFNNMIYILNIRNNLLHPETLIKENIELNNLKIIRFNLNYILDK